MEESAKVLTVADIRACKGKEEIYVRRSPLTSQCDAVYTIEGNGMAPMIRDGDQVMVAFTDTLEIAEIGVFLMNGNKPVIRQYYPEGLRSFRPDLESVHLEAGTQYPIIGRVLGVITDDMRMSPEDQKRLEQSEQEENDDSEDELD